MKASGNAIIILVLLLLQMSFAFAAPVPTRAIVNIKSPSDNAQIDKSSVFDVTADLTCSKRTCTNTRATISLPSGLTLPNNDAAHSLGNIADGATLTTSWKVSADAAGTYAITVSSTNTAKFNQPHSDSVSVSVIENLAPVANAGPDQSKNDADGNGAESFTLNGNASYDPDGTLVSYEWIENGNVVATGAIAQVSLGVGNHAITLRVTDNGGANATDTVSVNVLQGPPTVPTLYFSDDVESGNIGWSASGLWHTTQRRSSSPTTSWWYGNETTGNFETVSSANSTNGTNSSIPTRNYGDLISPNIDLTAASAPVLSFYTYWDTEALTLYDTKKVLISANNGETWQQLTQITNNNVPSKIWTLVPINLGTYAGSNVKLKFAFDTVDSISNNYEGWFIDDIEVKEQS